MLLAEFDHDLKPGPTIPLITGAVHAAATLETVTFDRLPRIAFRLVRGPVPHIAEEFTLTEPNDTSRLGYSGEFGADFAAGGVNGRPTGSRRHGRRA